MNSECPTNKRCGNSCSLLSPTAPFAVAHNEEFVPQANYGECRIGPGDRIDVVSPMAGG